MSDQPMPKPFQLMVWTDLVVLLAILCAACEHGARCAWRWRPS